MANVFQNMTELARGASVLLRDELAVGNLVNRDCQDKFTSDGGGTVRVSYNTVPTAVPQDHSVALSNVAASSVAESYVDVDARYYVPVKYTLNSREKTFEMDQLMDQVIRPSMVAIAEAAEQRIITKLAQGFGRNLTGTAGTAPAVMADIVSARKTLRDNKCPLSGLVAGVGTAAEAALLQVDGFINRDYGESNASALSEASLGRKYGIDFYSTQNFGGSFAQGDVAGTVLLNGAGTAGDTSIGIDALTAATGTIYAGTRFTIAGTATVYTVTADATIASNAATLSISPALSANEDDDDAITFQTAFTEDMIWNPGGTAAAIVAPAPLLVNSAVEAFEGISVRVSLESTTGDSSVGALDTLLFDTYVGAEVVRPEMGVIFQS